MDYQKLVDIRSLLMQLGIRAKELDSRFVSNCPSVSHHDKTPSWSVYKNSGFHVCFSCGFQGSLNHLVKYMTDKTIWEFCKIGQPENYIFKKTLELSKKEINGLNRGGFIYQSLGVFHSVYENQKVINYLLKRKVHPSFIKYFDIKYCIEVIFNDRKYTNRLLIPIYEGERLLSMEGRDFTEKQFPKCLYPKGATQNTLFNINNLDKTEPLIVTEGIMDTHKIWTNINRNVTCIFGNNITTRQAQLIDEFDTIFIPDNDKGGYQMIVNYDKQTEKEFEVAELSNSKDPGEASIKELIKSLKNKKSASRFFMEHAGIKEEKIIW